MALRLNLLLVRGEASPLIVWLNFRVLGHGVEVLEQALLARWIRGLLKHGAEDGVEEAGIFDEGRVITGSESSFDDLFGGGSDEFEAANEDAGCAGRDRFDSERKNGVHEGAGDDVDDAGAFFKPGIFPGFEHGVGFVGEEALRDERSFQTREEGIERAVERG